jgi:hypothetical protein
MQADPLAPARLPAGLPNPATGALPPAVLRGQVLRGEGGEHHLRCWKSIREPPPPS